MSGAYSSNKAEEERLIRDDKLWRAKSIGIAKRFKSELEGVQEKAQLDTSWTWSLKTLIEATQAYLEDLETEEVY